MKNTQAYSHRAVTKYDEKAYRALAALMIGRLRKWPRILLIAVGMLTTLGSAVIMLYTGQISLMGLTLLFCGSLMCIFGVFAQFFCVKMLLSSQKKGEPPVNTYLFLEDRLRVENEQTHQDYPYGDISRVLEMAGYLFLFTANGQIYLLGLEDVKGSLKEFREFFERKLTQSRKAKG